MADRRPIAYSMSGSEWREYAAAGTTDYGHSSIPCPLCGVMLLPPDAAADWNEYRCRARGCYFEMPAFVTISGPRLIAMMAEPDGAKWVARIVGDDACFSDVDAPLGVG